MFWLGFIIFVKRPKTTCMGGGIAESATLHVQACTHTHFSLLTQRWPHHTKPQTAVTAVCLAPFLLEYHLLTNTPTHSYTSTQGMTLRSIMVSVSTFTMLTIREKTGWSITKQEKIEYRELLSKTASELMNYKKVTKIGGRMMNCLTSDHFMIGRYFKNNWFPDQKSSCVACQHPKICTATKFAVKYVKHVMEVYICTQTNC